MPRRSADRGLRDVDPAVGVVHPVDGDLVDPQPAPLGQNQKFGVEEPFLVLDQRDERSGYICADRLETALGVRESGPEAVAQMRL